MDTGPNDERYLPGGSKVSKRRSKGVLKEFQGSFKDISRKFQGCLKKVPSVFQENVIKSFKDVSRIFKGSFYCNFVA